MVIDLVKLWSVSLGVFYNLYKIRRLSSVTACVYLGYMAASGTGHTSCVWT